MRNSCAPFSAFRCVPCGLRGFPCLSSTGEVLNAVVIAGFTPSGLVVGGGVGRNWTDPVGGGAEVFAWRSGHWNNWMFVRRPTICHEPARTEITFHEN